jgi:serine O-acetyltransferase
MANDTPLHQALVQAIVASYEAEPRTRHIDAGHLPNRDVIIELTKLIRELLFPGYFGKQNLTARTLEYHVGELITIIHDKLYEQVRNAIRHQATRSGAECPNCDATAEMIVQEFLGSLPQLRTTLATDVKAAFDGDPAAKNTDEIIFSYPGLFAISVFRIAHLLFKAQVPLIPRIMTEYAHNLTGIDIHPGADIDDFFFIDHGTGVVIGETCEIGNHVKLYQGVTLGAKSFEVDTAGNPVKGVKRHPDIGENVTIYAHATILGGDTQIGAHSVIGGNVWLLESIPPNSITYYKGDDLVIRPRKKKEALVAEAPDWVI